MTGSALVAGWIAHLVFWAVLGLGFVVDYVRPRLAAVFVALWLIGYLGLPRMLSFGGLFITPYVAILDVLLVAVVLKGDLRLT